MELNNRYFVQVVAKISKFETIVEIYTECNRNQNGFLLKANLNFNSFYFKLF